MERSTVRPAERRTVGRGGASRTELKKATFRNTVCKWSQATEKKSESNHSAADKDAVSVCSALGWVLTTHGLRASSHQACEVPVSNPMLGGAKRPCVVP